MIFKVVFFPPYPALKYWLQYKRRFVVFSLYFDLNCFVSVSLYIFSAFTCLCNVLKYSMLRVFLSLLTNNYYVSISCDSIADELRRVASVVVVSSSRSRSVGFEREDFRLFRVSLGNRHSSLIT